MKNKIILLFMVLGFTSCIDNPCTSVCPEDHPYYNTATKLCYSSKEYCVSAAHLGACSVCTDKTIGVEPTKNK